MPADLETALELYALRERQEFLERRQRELEAILLDFLRLAAIPGNREGRPMSVLDRLDTAPVISIPRRDP